MYNYSDEKSKIFTERGQEMFLEIRDRINSVIKKSGAITMGAAISCSTGGTWQQMACVDRMVELGELKEIEQVNKPAGQNRIFMKPEMF